MDIYVSNLNIFQDRLTQESSDKQKKKWGDDLLGNCIDIDI
jgi:hypothetical protein